MTPFLIHFIDPSGAFAIEFNESQLLHFMGAAGAVLMMGLVIATVVAATLAVAVPMIDQAMAALVATTLFVAGVVWWAAAFKEVNEGGWPAILATPQNADSCADIVANTAGVLVALALLSILSLVSPVAAVYVGLLLGTVGVSLVAMVLWIETQRRAALPKFRIRWEC